MVPNHDHCDMGIFAGKETDHKGWERKSDEISVSKQSLNDTNVRSRGKPMIDTKDFLCYNIFIQEEYGMLCT